MLERVNYETENSLEELAQRISSPQISIRHCALDANLPDGCLVL